MALGNEQPKKYRTFNLGKCYMGGGCFGGGGLGGGWRGFEGGVEGEKK